MNKDLNIYQSVCEGIDKMENGAIPVASFLMKLEETKGMVKEIFTDLYEKLAEIKAEPNIFARAREDSRRDQMITLKGCEILFRQGFEIVRRSYQDNDKDMLGDGLFLIKTGDEKMYSLIQTLNDGAAHPLSHLSLGGDLFAHTVEKLSASEINLREYGEIILDYENETLDYIKNGTALFQNSVQHPKSFTGQEMDSLVAASEMLEKAANEVMKGLSNMYQEPR